MPCWEYIQLPFLSWLLPPTFYLRWLEEPSGTPQVLGSTPCGSEFQAEVKKIPSLALCAKALVVSRPQVGLRTLTFPRQTVPRGYVSQCQGGARVRGFSRSGKPSLLLDNTGGAVFPHPAEFFFEFHTMMSTYSLCLFCFISALFGFS